jgi:hypothetical protein
LLLLLTDYFEETWIGRPTRLGVRRPPNFSLELWNQYDSTLAGLLKTNNNVEGWHRAFSSLLGSCHPTIWQLYPTIDILKNQQNLTDIKINQFIVGQEPPKQKKNIEK